MTSDETEPRDDEQRDDEQRDEDSTDSGDERVKDRGRYEDETPGVTDARPGREDIGEGHMPSDYHEAVAQRPVEVKLPETPDLSEDSEDSEDAEGSEDAEDADSSESSPGGGGSSKE